MRIAFHTDASLKIGTGHVMRCLTLADKLRERGSECHFICRQHKGHMIDLRSVSRLWGSVPCKVRRVLRSYLSSRMGVGLGWVG